MKKALIEVDSSNSNVWGHIKAEEVLDWYLPVKDPLSGRVVIKDEFVDLGKLPQCEEFVNLLFAEIEKIPKEVSDFNLKIDRYIDGVKKRFKFRGHKQFSIDGEFIILRKMPMELPELKNLGLPDAIQYILTHENLNTGGLVIICGEPGNGKSTTSAAMIRTRLHKFGGFCLTLENPVEMPLHGQHGIGYCLQTPVEEGDFEKALSSAMRCYPTATKSMLFLGEVRSSETAAEALRIANNGHLVITTLHSSGTMTCLKRILAMAKSKSLSDEEASSLLSSSLRLVIHQKLDYSSEDKKLKISFLFSENNHSPVANRIRGGGVDNLITEIEQQNQMLRSGQGERLFDQWKKTSENDERG